jgi:transcriptional regulator with XRE-family HTH domain
MTNELLKQIRLILGMSQESLGKRVGVSKSVLARVENGQIPLQPHTERKVQEVFRAEGITDSDTDLLAGVLQTRKLVKKGF